MNKNQVSHPRVQGRDDEGLTIVDEAEMTNDRLVEDPIDHSSIVCGALRRTANPRPARREIT